MLDKVTVDKLDKYKELAQELRGIRRMRVEIISVIVSSLGAVHAKTLEQLSRLCQYNNEKEKKLLWRRLSEAAVLGSFRLWRCYMEGRVRAGEHEDFQVFVRKRDWREKNRIARNMMKNKDMKKGQEVDSLKL
jgi:hypothetical protein